MKSVMKVLAIFEILHFMCLSEHLLAKRAQQIGVLNCLLPPLFSAQTTVFIAIASCQKAFQLYITILPLVSATFVLA